MTTHFNLAEFTASDSAARLRINNELPAGLFDAAILTLEMLERIRARLSLLAGRDVPMILSSGYRCPALNAAIGSAPTSDHIKAMAADWTAPSFGTPFEVCTWLAPLVGDIGIGQLINERVRGGEWIHTSTRMPALAVNRIITISSAGTVPGIVMA